MRNFKELKIWQKGIEIAIDTYKTIEEFPVTEKFSLSQQATRAAVSIASNIAEGSSRTSAKALHFGSENKLQNILYKSLFKIYITGNH